MKILFLTNLLPYPLDNGGRIKTYTTIKSLYEGGHIIDLVCFKEQLKDYLNEEKALTQICNSVKQIYLRLTTAENKLYMIKLAVFSLLSKFSLGVYKYRSKKMIEYIMDLKSSTEYDCIYFDHLPLFVYYTLTCKLWPNAKTVLDEHNCETVIMYRNLENSSSFIKRLFLKVEAYKLKRFECMAIREVDKTVVLSKEDYEALKLMCGKDFRHIVIPIGLDDKGVKKNHDKHNEEINILFIGTLTWEPNNHGLLWFLDNVVPILQNNEYKFKLYIVGKNPSAAVKERVEKFNNIELMGYVPSVEEFYEKCQFTIVPLFIGSGQRVKIIEAFSYGMPTISTTIGAEGLEYNDGEDILIADTAIDFARQMEKITDIDLRIKLSRNCRLIYEKNYSFNAVANLINHAVEIE